MDEPIRVVAYDPQWPERFERERALLAEEIGPWVVGGIHHVGSTAVPGLDAKPTIDILAGVEDLEKARGCFRDELAFRDRLRMDAGLAHEYAELKRSLAMRFQTDREGYTEGKSDFVARVLNG